MKPVEGIIGPGMSSNELSLDLPEFVDTPAKAEALKHLIEKAIAAANRNAASVLRSMLAQTPGAAQLAGDFDRRLGIP